MNGNAAGQPLRAAANKASLDLSEDNLDAHYGDNSLIVMKNDFYNDDFYDYKDTFIQRVNTASGAGEPAKIMAGHEDFDYDLGVPSDDNDSTNFFETGPLATSAKKAPESDEDFAYDNSQRRDTNPVRFRDTEDDNFCKDLSAF